MTEQTSQPLPTPSTSETSSQAPTKLATVQPGPTTEDPIQAPGADSITELFSRYPDVTQEQAKRVITHLRETRGKIGLDQKPIKEAKPRVSKAKSDPKKPKLTAAELADLLDLPL